MIYLTKVVLLAVIAIIIGFLVASGKSQMASPIEPTTATENIKDESGLFQAQDELEAINVDSLDTGLNQINSATGSF